jgi:hypothetical protein
MCLVNVCMKKVFWFVFWCFLAFSISSAQPSVRTFDNFDRSDLKIYIPVPPAPKREKKGNIKKTALLNKSQNVATDDSKLSKKISVREELGFRGFSFDNVKMSAGNSLKGFTTGDPKIDEYIVEFSTRHKIDPLLIYAQMHQESSFNRYAVSPKGASGLMQLMPATAKRFGVTNIFDPRQNIEAGVKYMRWLLDTFNQDLVLALAGYNAGEGAVMKYGWQVPPYSETREYVRRILLRYSIIQDPSIVQRMTKRISQSQAKKLLESEEPKPLRIYEPTPIVILVDGKPRLVTQ